MARRKTAGQVLDAALKEYPEEFLSCRDMGHMWRAATAQRRPDRTVERVLACDRCGARRTQVLDAAGYIIASSYVYAKHYQIQGAGRWGADNRARMRAANLLRLLGR